MSQLVLCLGCTRHVRVDDPRCPFCGGQVRGPTPAPRRVTGLGRAALMALGTSVAACGPGDSTTIEVIEPTQPIEAVAPSEPEIAPTEPVEAPSEPVEVVEPTEPTEPTEPAEVVEPTEPPTPPPPPRPVPRDRIGAPVPAYGGPPPAPFEPEPRARPSRPPEDDNGGNVPLYGGPGLD